MAEKIQAYYFIGSSNQVYEKTYDGTKLQADSLTYDGYENGDSFQAQITNGNMTHVNQYGTMTYDFTLGKYKGTLDLHYDEGYPKVSREEVDVTDLYNQTQTSDPTFVSKTPGCKTFTIIARDITLQSATISKEYDGTVLTAYSNPPGGGTKITDLTAGQTDKGYVSGEEFNYTFTGSQLFVGSSDNIFTVSDKTALTSDYNVTTQYGQLVVTKRTAPLTITVNDQEKLYDGTASINANAYSVTGDLAYGDTITVTLTNKDGSVNAGTYTDGITATYKIMHGDTDVTDMYANVTVNAGDLIIDKRNVTITSGNATKAYDGTPLTKNSTQITGGDGFVGGEGYTATVTGSQTEVGTSKNYFTVSAAEGTNLNNYNITKIEGDLTVTPASALTITIGLDATTGLSYLYDGTSTKTLQEGQYQVTGLLGTDKIQNVTISTESANVGIYNDDQALTYTVTYDLVDAAGQDASSHYDSIILNKNDVAITPRYITIQAGSTSKSYDGTALTCDDWALAVGGLAENEKIDGVKMTEDSTITHAGSTANKVDPTGVTISKADGSDSSMNYVVDTLDGTLTVTKRNVLLISTSADKYYDGTALQNRQVIVTGLSYLEGKPVEGEGFLPGDGCTYDFVNDNCVIDAQGNVISWTVSEQSDTAYGQTDVGASKNEFNYHNFTSIYAGSYETDYEIIYGNNTPDWFIAKYGQKVADNLFGDLTVWGGPVEINMTDYSWTYDYQSKHYGYFDDGYTVVFTTKEGGSENETTVFAHNSEGQAVALFGKDEIVVTVTGQGGSFETGKVQHVSDGTKQNVATYKIYRDGNDVTNEVKDYYQVSIDGGELKITPRTVEITSGSASKRYDGLAITDNTVTEGTEGRLEGFVFGEGAAYEVTGSQTEIGTSANTFEISELLTDTKATDYNFELQEGTLTVTSGPVSDYNYSSKSDIIQFVNGLVYMLHDTKDGYKQTAAINDVTGWEVKEYRRDLTGDSLCDVQITSDDGKGSTWVAMLRNDYMKDGAITLNYQFIGAYENKLWSYLGSADTNGDGKAEVLMMQTDAGLDKYGHRNIAAWVTDETGTWSDSKWIGSLLSTEWAVAGTADLDGNGTDNVILRRADGMIGYWSEAGTNDIVEIWNAGNSVMLSSADFNGDGADDLLFTNADGDFFTWKNIGEGVIADKIGNINDLGGNWNFAGAGDYNGDGNNELLWCDDVNVAFSEANKENFKNLTVIA